MSDGASLIPRKLSSSVKASTGRLHFPPLLCLLPWCLMVKTEKKIFNMVPIQSPLPSLCCIAPPRAHGFIIGIPSLNRRKPIFPVASVTSVRWKVSEANLWRSRQLKFIIAEAHNNPLREAFWGGYKCTASHSEAKKDCKIFLFFWAKKEARLKGKQQRKHLFFLCACTLSLGF